MSEINVRTLDVEDWREYREARLAALQDSPHAFLAAYEEESVQAEQFWRDRMARARRFLAVVDGKGQGIVSLGAHDGDGTDTDEQTGEIFGLWVSPSARNIGMSWQLVQAAVTDATKNGLRSLYYWVGTDNGRAIAFASNFGFRPSSSRRPTRVTNEEFGDQEIAMMLPLSSDPGSVPNPTRGRPTSHSGPNQ